MQSLLLITWWNGRLSALGAPSQWAQLSQPPRRYTTSGRAGTSAGRCLQSRHCCRERSPSLRTSSRACWNGSLALLGVRGCGGYLRAGILRFRLRVAADLAELQPSWF
jgi:hypothetical protein